MVGAAVALSALAAAGNASAADAPTVRPEIVATYPHDPGAFTQGLLLYQGKLYESTGLLGRSSLRRVVLTTGVVEKRVDLDPNVFGEGLALVDNRFFQITWQDHVAYTYDLDFASVGRFEYTGEGWGLCFDGQRLVMSDGSSRLFFRNPTTFEVQSDIEVRDANGPVTNLNELECVGSLVFANVWQTTRIVRIDPRTGDVLTSIDGSNLLTPEEAAGADVLNGIAYDPTTTHFFITGKLWPKLFEVRFAFNDASDAGGGDTGGSGAATGGSSPTGGSSATGGASTTSGSGGAGEPEPTPLKTAHPPRSRSTCGCAVPGEARDLRELSLLAGMITVVSARRSRRRRR
jgi:glutaminyl-peptide cyclotransferase